MTSSPPAPHDIPAEQGVLGSMLASTAAAQKCRELLDPDDFYRPLHQVIFRLIGDLARDGKAHDTIAVKAALEEAGQRFDPLYLVTLMEQGFPVNAGSYAAIVRDRAVRRRLVTAAVRILQWCGPGQPEDAWGLVERARRELEAVAISGSADGITTEPVSEFMDRVAAEMPDSYDWVIPDLVERGDRVVITGFEGCGKSCLLRQFAVCTAAGIHVLKHTPIPPKRVMILDAENEEVATWRELRPLLAQARLQGFPVSDDNLQIQCCRRRNLLADKDVSWLLRQVGAYLPDVLVLGPLYKMAIRAINTDDEAAVLLSVLDMVRSRGCAILLEAHSGHAVGPGGQRDPRPRGSSALLGWPEFGMGLRWSSDPQAKRARCVDVVPWRGGRDATRVWPEMLISGGPWPWRIAYPTAKNDPGEW